MILISNGETDSMTTLMYNSMFILSGGSANETTLKEKSILNVSKGGETGNTYISSGGTMNIFKGGLAWRVNLYDMGSLFVSKGGKLEKAYVNGCGTVEICKGASAGEVNVSGGGFATFSGAVSSAAVHMGGTIDVCGGTIDSAVVYSGTITLNKGTIGSAIVHKDFLNVCKGGTANNVSVEKDATVTIDGGAANDLTVKGGEVYAYGGTINKLTVNGGNVYVSGGATLKDVNVDKDGRIEIEGAAAGNLTVLEGDVTVGSGGKLTGVTLSNADLHVSSGGTVSKLTLEDNSDAYLSYSGTSASDVTVKNDCGFYVYEDTAANNVTLENGGSMMLEGTVKGLRINAGTKVNVFSGAVATKVSWTPGDGVIQLDDRATISFASKYSGVYYGLTGAFVSQTKQIDFALGAGASAYVAKGGSANAVELLNGGTMEVWSGGTATGTTINDNCDLKVSGGLLNDTQVNDGGVLNLRCGRADSTHILDGGEMSIEGGSASGVTIEEGGVLSIESGTATDVNWTPFVGSLSLDSDARITFANELTGIYTAKNAHTEEALGNWNVTDNHSMFVMSGASANNTQLYEGGIFVFGGTVTDTVFALDNHAWYGASMCLYDNASALNTVVSNGDMKVYDGAIAEHTTVRYGGVLYVCSGGSAVDVTNETGSVNVNGGYVSDVIISSGRSMDVYNSGFVSNAVASGGIYLEGATVYVSSGAVVSNLVLEYGAFLYVEKGAKVVNVTSGYGSLIAAEKGGTVKVTGALAVESQDCDHDEKNGWDDKKKKTVNELVMASSPVEIDRSTSEIKFDEKDMTYGSYRNFVGFGDEIDFVRIELDSAAVLSFIVETTDVAKFTIWRWDDSKGKMVSLQSTTLKISNPALGKDCFAETKGLLLADPYCDYYLSVESTNAAKGGNAYYKVSISSNSIFFDNCDENKNDWLYEGGKKGRGENTMLVNYYKGVTIVDTLTNVQVDDYAPTGEDGWNNFVGCGDPDDYQKIIIAKDGATASFHIEATDQAKFVIYSYDKETHKMKSLQTTKLKYAGDIYYTATTKDCTFKTAGEYYIAVTSTNAKKGGNAYYNVELVSTDITESDLLGNALTADLAMPEAASGRNQTDDLSFGQYDVDMLADASASTLAEPDDKSAWLNLAKLA